VSSDQEKISSAYNKARCPGVTDTRTKFTGIMPIHIGGGCGNVKDKSNSVKVPKTDEGGSTAVSDFDIVESDHKICGATHGIGSAKTDLIDHLIGVTTQSA